MRKSFYIFLSFLLLSPTAGSQDFEWNTGFDGFLDNREYFSIKNPQTIFGARLRAEIGASISETHRLRGGLNYLYEFGSDPYSRRPDVTMYYELDYKSFNFFIGAFPRRTLLCYPLSLMSDTLDYYRPNIQGIYLGLNKKWGYQNIFIDWTSRQTDSLPERFIFAQSGEAHFGLFYYNHHFMMGHFAGNAIEVDNSLRDNGGFDLNLGTNLSSLVPLDTLLFHVGTLVSLDRNRQFYNYWKTPAGFTVGGMVMWKGLGLEGLYYRGKGHTFLYGDPFYRLKEYGRLDIFWSPFRSGAVRAKINVILHFANGQVDYSQQLLLSIDLDGQLPHH
ncbi:hypothetical protein ACFLTU_07700 [Bacteroidota bacterium]